MLKDAKSFSGYSVDNIEAAREFYANKLGLNVKIDRMGMNFKTGSGTEVFLYEKPNHQAATYTVLNFVVDNIETAVDSLADCGVKFEHYDNLPASQDERGILRGRAANQGPDIAWFKDPAGNILSVVQN